jgi:hypothetical protein
VLIRSRSARFAALALALTPLSLAVASPAFADNGNDDTTVWITEPMVPGVVGVHSSKDLSKVTVVLCGGDYIVADHWNGQDGEVQVGDGVVQAVFIHAGNNTNPADEQLLLDLTDDPQAVDGSSTGAKAYYDKDACVPGDDGTNDDDTNDDDTNHDGSNHDGSNHDGTNNDDDTTVQLTVITDDHQPVKTTETSSSDPAPKSEVLGVTLTDGNNPAPAAAPAASPAVSGNNAVAPAAELPHTGAGNIQFLMALALSLLAAGVALRAAFGRRIRSASSPS